MNKIQCPKCKNTNIHLSGAHCKCLSCSFQWRMTAQEILSRAKPVKQIINEPDTKYERDGER